MWLILRVGAIAGDCDFIARRYKRFIAPQIIVRGRLTELLVLAALAKIENKQKVITPSRNDLWPIRTFSFVFRRDYRRVTFPVINIILIASRVPVVVQRNDEVCEHWHVLIISLYSLSL